MSNEALTLSLASLSPGTHVRAKRPGYWHHGIYAGYGMVIHLAGDAVASKRTARVRLGPFHDFSAGQHVEVVQGDENGPGWLVLQRAQSALGLARYDLLSFNCETFARWAATGKPSSKQVAVALTLGCFAVLLVAIAYSE